MSSEKTQKTNHTDVNKDKTPAKPGSDQTTPKEPKRYPLLGIPDHPRSPMTLEEINRYLGKAGTILAIDEDEIKKYEENARGEKGDASYSVLVPHPTGKKYGDRVYPELKIVNLRSGTTFRDITFLSGTVRDTESKSNESYSSSVIVKTYQMILKREVVKYLSAPEFVNRLTERARDFKNVRQQLLDIPAKKMVEIQYGHGAGS